MTPTAPIARAAIVAVTFRVYDSALGEIPAAGFTKSVPASSTAESSRIWVHLSDLKVSGVDPLRAALYEPHQGSQMGSFVASTTSGHFDLPRPRQDATYDLLLMSTAAGVNYDSLDAAGRPAPGPVRRYATLRLAAPSEVLLGQQVLDETDESFRFVAEEFSRALNPFGLQYGRVDYVGTAATGDMACGWVTVAPQTCHTVQASPEGFWVNSGYMTSLTQYAPIRDSRCWAPQPYIYHVFGGTLMVRGLAEAYLGASDLLFLECLLAQCPDRPGWLLDPKPPLSARGKDIVRYWVLMNGSLQ